MLIVIALAQVLNAMVVGGVAWYFALHQKRIAQEQKKVAQAKLRLDLFDKRFRIFNSARLFLGKALNRVEPPDEQAFIINTSEAAFLLSDDLANYLDGMFKRVIDLPFKLHDLHGAQTDEERKKAEEAYTAERKWLRDEYAVLAAKFRPFMVVEG